MLDTILDKITDPEIPVLTIRDLGILRNSRILDDGTVEVTITPTYSGCPAMNAIEVNIRAVLQDAGYDKVQVITALTPAWTTAWMTETGKQKLQEYGIAPPQDATMDKKALIGGKRILECPLCHSTHTEMISQFSSTSCKALFRCLDCLEPFDYFKCH